MATPNPGLLIDKINTYHSFSTGRVPQTDQAQLEGGII